MSALCQSNSTGSSPGFSLLRILATQVRQFHFLIPVIACCFRDFPTTPFQKSEKLTNKVEVASLGPPLAYLLAHLLRSRGNENVRVDRAWSCGRDAHISVRCIRRRRCVGRSCLSAPNTPGPLL